MRLRSIVVNMLSYNKDVLSSNPGEGDDKMN